MSHGQTVWVERSESLADKCLHEKGLSTQDKIHTSIYQIATKITLFVICANTVLATAAHNIMWLASQNQPCLHTSLVSQCHCLSP